MIPSMRGAHPFQINGPSKITKYSSKFIINSFCPIELYYMYQFVLNQRIVIWELRFKNYVVIFK